MLNDFSVEEFSERIEVEKNLIDSNTTYDIFSWKFRNKLVVNVLKDKETGLIVGIYEPKTELQQRLTKRLVSLLLNDIQELLNKTNIKEVELKNKIPVGYMSDLVLLEELGVITTTTTKEVLKEMFNTGKEAIQIIREHNLFQVNDNFELDKVVDKILENNNKAVLDFKSGKEQALKFLMGQIMKETKGQANPQKVNELLRSKLE